jgi:cell division protein FtsQ
MSAEALLDLKDLGKRDKSAQRRHLQAVMLDQRSDSEDKPDHFKRKLIIGAGLVCIVVTISLALLKNYAASFAIEHVLIKGEFHNEQAQAIEQALQPHLVGDLFTVDLSAAHAALIDLPWVADARLQRVWPNKVNVSLQEQVPVARWNTDRLVNSRGEVFSKAYGVNLDELPVFAGPEYKADVVLEQYEQLQQVLMRSELHIIQLSVDERNSWSMTTNNNVVMRLGRRDIESRLERFLAVMKSDQKTDWSQIASVDLRHSNGFAVCWQSKRSYRNG